jgi:undecaprenyl diphosphate synthase
MNLTELIPNGRPPLHIALLPDGARRWASKKSVCLRDSYLLSAQHLSRVVTWLFNGNCNEISLLLSNWRNHLRTQSECEAFEIGMREFINVELPKYQLTWNCSVQLLCPEDIHRTTGFSVPGILKESTRKLHICVAYDPLREIVSAVETAYRSGQSVDRFPMFLQIKRPVDLAIRTGGFILFSGFIPLQLSYARLHCLDTLFNDTTEDDYRFAVRKFLDTGAKYGD